MLDIKPFVKRFCGLDTYASWPGGVPGGPGWQRKHALPWRGPELKRICKPPDLIDNKSLSCGLNGDQRKPDLK